MLQKSSYSQDEPAQQKLQIFSFKMKDLKVKACLKPGWRDNDCLSLQTSFHRSQALVLFV